MEFIYSQEAVLYLYIPLLIFIARVIDVSMGTFRIILISKGIKLPAAIIGFFEVLIWIIAIAVILDNLNNILGYLAYATGFACGTFVGITIEEKISIGKVRLTIMTKKNIHSMVEKMEPTRYVYVGNLVQSSNGRIRIIHAFLERKFLVDVLKRVKEEDPDAFFTVEDLKMLREVEGAGDIKKSAFYEKFFSMRK
jgi:uncharacterized protein YebE (UPF0316 family)